MRETGIAPVVARRTVDLLVLAEHHAERERRVPLREPGRDRPLGPATQAVEHTRDATTSRAGEPDALDHQLARDPAATQMGGEVEAGVGVLRRPAQGAGQRELVAYRRPAGERGPVSAVEAQQEAAACEGAGGDASLSGRAKRGRSRACEEVGAGRERAAVVDLGRCVVERIESRGARRAPRQKQGGGEHREQRRAGASQTRKQDGGGRKA